MSQRSQSTDRDLNGEEWVDPYAHLDPAQREEALSRDMEEDGIDPIFENFVAEWPSLVDD